MQVMAPLALLYDPAGQMVQAVEASEPLKVPTYSSKGVDVGQVAMARANESTTYHDICEHIRLLHVPRCKVNSMFCLQQTVVLWNYRARVAHSLAVGALV